jgi:RNA polymerase sigma-70 factor, ECF subfamily
MARQPPGTLPASQWIEHRSMPRFPGRLDTTSAGCGGMTEARLIERACEGDSLAARTLYERYAPRVYAVVRRIAGDDDLADDYAQEAWIRVFRALPGFRGEARFSTWLHRIAVNAAIQALRRHETRETRRGEMPERGSVHPELPDVFLEQRLERALDRVPGGMRRVLILHDVEGYTHEEIGEMLGISSGTSKSQLFKARARMREILAGTSLAEFGEGVEAWSI